MRHAYFFDHRSHFLSLIPPRTALQALGRDVDDRDSPFYKDTFRQPIYNAMYRAARDCIAAGTNCVLVGPFTRELQQADWLQSTLRAAVTPESSQTVQIDAYWVVCSEQTRLQRMAARGNPRDAAKLADWKAHQNAYEETEPAFAFYRINT